MNRNRLIALLIGVAVLIAIAIVVITQLIIPGSTQSNTAGTQPKAPTIVLPFNANDSAAQLVMDVHPINQAKPTATPAALYVSCTTQRGATPTPIGAVATAAATDEAVAT